MPEGAYTVYRHERRGCRWPYIVAAVACVLASLAVWQLVDVPRVSAVEPGPDSYIKHHSPVVVLDVRGLAKLGGVRVALDGRDVTGQVIRRGDELSLATAGLADGAHTVSFSASSSNLFRHQVQRAWRFTVDTRIPTLALARPADVGRINSLPATFKGSTEPFCTVAVTSGNVKASASADADGRYSVSARLPEGSSVVTVTAVDRAGNSASRRLHVYVDTVPPVLKVTRLPRTLRHSGLKIHISAHDQLVTPKVKLVLDGAPRTVSGPVSHGVLALKNLAQGTHTLAITAADRGGNVVTSTQTFVVDSTQHFGRGRHVAGRSRQGRARSCRSQPGIGTEVWSAAATSTIYGRRTVAAVKEVTGQVGPRRWMAWSAAARSPRSAARSSSTSAELRLYLYRGGKLVKTYPVAAGQPVYPTPTGTFAIVNMTMNPTWLPPTRTGPRMPQKIPPGTENPLGTRWMGTSAPGVGIHGVPPQRRRIDRHLRVTRLPAHAQLQRGRPLLARERGHAGDHPSVTG